MEENWYGDALGGGVVSLCDMGSEIHNDTTTT